MIGSLGGITILIYISYIFFVFVFYFLSNILYMLICKQSLFVSFVPFDQRECENKKEHEDLLKDLANYKVQLEDKEVAYKQALLKL